MNLARLVAAFSALLALAGCSATPYTDASQNLQPFASSSTGATPSSTEPSTRPGVPRALGDGLAVTISPPKAFTPTDAAFPRAPRAVAFDLLIDNDGTDTYRPSQLSVTATSNGAAALQLIDSTQGYTGFMGTTDDEVAPGGHLRVSVAFALPAERAEVALTLQPSTADSRTFILFTGAV